METVTISFPGLGIGEFTVNKVIFSIGSVSIRWYGLLITLGMILAFLYTIKRGKQYNISFDSISDIALFTIIFAIIGARLYYVLTSLDKYTNFWDIFKIWEGGLGVYGGLIAGAITIIVCAKIKKINILQLLDCTAPGVMLAQAMGRWGNFFNGEAYGSETSSNFFLRMGINPHYDITSVASDQMAYVHPTFLYESMWNLLGFALINIFYKKKKFDGEIVLAYATWYGFGRFFIEMLRTDSLYIPGTSIKISCAVGLICFVAGLILILFFRHKAMVRETAKTPYQSIYSKSEDSATAVSETQIPEESENVATEINEDKTPATEPQQATEAEQPEEKEDGTDH